VQQAENLKAKGVDEIVCVAVNDAFVMAAWGKSVGVDGKVSMLADGNCEFTQAMGRDFDASAPGLGTRSQRYSMIVDDGVVTTLNVEEGRNFDVSDAETLLGQL